MTQADTIFAPATPTARSGVAVLRLSGPRVKEALAAIGITPLPAARVASLQRFRHPISGEAIDQGLALWFPAPGSFTGEDVAELHAHGSRAVIKALTDALMGLGLRLADPGEFTRRAFLNGKMDLTAAEGLIDLIDAETESQRKQALSALSGSVGKRFAELRDLCVKALAHLEAYIDFPDEEIPESVRDTIRSEVEELSQRIRSLLDDQHRGERIREGFSVVILGAPNAGKSTLMNTLAQRDVAIVSHHAGTTRDVIETHLDIGGYAVVLVDTAGLRDSTDEIEQEGIRRARERAESADLKLVLFDGSELPKLDAASSALIDTASLAVISKSDSAAGKLPAEIAGQPALALSTRTGDGVEALLKAIEARLGSLTSGGSSLITRARHRTLLASAINHLSDFSMNSPIELACEELRLAAVSLGKITGKIEVDELLDRVFAEFCIGK